MMKAMGPKRGSRKKISQPQPPLPAQPPPPPTDPPRVAVRSQPSAVQNHPQPQNQQQQQQQQYAPQPKHPLQQETLQHQNRQAAPRRQRYGPTLEQVELTKKNYRLAKELSELRVRHREECKNVTRLTMENMNLASRCREAISHVAMLKKELVNYQTRAKEEIRLQREETQRMASNLSAEVSRLSRSFSDENGSSASSSAKKSEMERVLSSPPPPPPPPRAKTPSTTPVQKPTEPSGTVVTPKHEGAKSNYISSDEDDTVEDTTHGRSVLDIVESLSELSSPSPPKSEKPPRVYSTPNRHRREDRWTPTIDDAPGSVEKDQDGMTLFPHSASPKVVGLNRPKSYNEEFPGDIMPNGSSSTHRSRAHLMGDEDDDDEEEERGPTLLERHSGFITMNSIDAFEASFDTAFPTAFTSQRNVKSTGKSNSDTYNPFAPSPARSMDRSLPSTPSSGSSRSTGSPEITPPPTLSTGFGTLGSSGDWSDELNFSTPPKASPSGDPEPHRPHKTPSAEARARYEKALQPRNDSKNDHNDISEKTGGFFKKTSPSRLLQRMQQRRKKDPAEGEHCPGQGSPSESPSRQENVAPRESPRAESGSFSPAYPEPQRRPSPSPKSQRLLDEAHHVEQPVNGYTTESIQGRPGGMVARLSALKSRRSIKQPVSYAEPSLNTKIRSGHDYFPKNGTSVETTAVPH